MPNLARPTIYESTFTKYTCPIRSGCTLILLLFLVGTINIRAQEGEIEEIPVNVRIEGLGAAVFNPLYEYGSERLYLPVMELFQFLQIKVEPSASLDTLSGFMVKEENHYLIDNQNKKIIFGGKEFSIAENQLLNTGTDLFMDHRLFGEIFGLHANSISEASPCP